VEEEEEAAEVVVEEEEEVGEEAVEEEADKRISDPLVMITSHLKMLEKMFRNLLNNRLTVCSPKGYKQR
jgi:K+-sensing histidine kinase KdpD